MDVEYIDHMGSDLTVVNAARVSFNKESNWVGCDCEDDELDNCPSGGEFGCPMLSHKDQKLVNYLAKHKHISPFGHCFASFRVKAPIFVARQLVKHKFLRWNEVSRRYVDDEPEFFEPDYWRARPDGSVKQGSGKNLPKGVDLIDFEHLFDKDMIVKYTDGYDNYTHLHSIEGHHSFCVKYYQHLINSGVCPEQARMVLPQSMYTEWWWSGSLDAFADMCRLRLDPHAQKESRVVAEKIDATMRELFPVSWKALLEN